MAKTQNKKPVTKKPEEIKVDAPAADNTVSNAPESEEPKKGKATKNAASYVVASSFRDINDFNRVYSEGEDVSHFDEKRLEGLVANNMVQKK